jgi:hypothetical protein
LELRLEERSLSASGGTGVRSSDRGGGGIATRYEKLEDVLSNEAKRRCNSCDAGVRFGVLPRLRWQYQDAGRSGYDATVRVADSQDLELLVAHHCPHEIVILCQQPKMIKRQSVARCCGGVKKVDTRLRRNQGGGGGGGV